MIEIKLYVGTFRKYNEGSVFGDWITLTEFDNLKDFYNECRALHKDEEDPEFMFQDWEVNTSILKPFIRESWIDKDIFKYIKYLEEADNSLEVYEAFDDLEPFDFIKNEADFLDHIRRCDELLIGEYERWEDFVYEEAQRMVGGREDLIHFLGLDKVGRELMHDFDHSNGVVFRAG